MLRGLMFLAFLDDPVTLLFAVVTRLSEYHVACRLFQRIRLTTCAQKLFFRTVVWTNVALSHFVDDHEPCDVKVSLFTVQLLCAFVCDRTFLLLLEQLFSQLVFVWRLHNKIGTIPYVIEPLLLFLVKHSVTRCEGICLYCQGVKNQI